MIIIDHEPHTWFLAEAPEGMYFDVHCSHGAVSYGIAIKLSAEELAEYGRRGHAYLNALAEEIHYSAPGVIGSSSLYAGRRVAAELAAELDAAINAWQASQ
ncbi:hypothetical protein [Pandoraea pnomenusa]|uniref:hypothetical protein n=1 Tax=Pandoraea pnomenusa TaxID=93220 RepID=UPI00333F2007